MAKYLILPLLILSILSITTMAQIGSQFGPHFDSGMENFEKARYSTALQEFGSACRDNPDRVECRFYYALAMYYTDKLKEARSEFNKIAIEEKGSQWGIAARSYVEAIDNGYFAPLPGKDFNGYINLLYETDDNVTFAPSLVAEKADNKSSASVSVSYNPLIFSLRPLSFSYNVYGLWYDKNSNYDLNGSSSGVLFRLPLPLQSFATFSYGSGYYYLKNDPYYAADYIDARYTINAPAGSAAWTSIYVGGTNGRYKIASYVGYDGYESRIGVRQDLNAMTYLQYDLKSSDTRRDDFANMSSEYSLGQTIHFPYFHRLSAVIKYMDKLFEHDDLIANELRHDTSFGIDLSVTKDLTRYLGLEVKYDYTNYTSNLASDSTSLGYGSYVNHVLSLSISYKF